MTLASSEQKVKPLMICCICGAKRPNSWSKAEEKGWTKAIVYNPVKAKRAWCPLHSTQEYLSKILTPLLTGKAKQ